MVKLKILNATWTKILVGKELITPCLSYEQIYYKQGPFHKVPVARQAKVIWKDLILTGHIPRIKSFCGKRGINLSVEGQLSFTTTIEPVLKDITLKEHQRSLVKIAREVQRGVLISPTGSGKTVTALALMSSWPGNKLFLTQSRDLVTQTAKAIQERMGLRKGEIGLVVEGKTDFKPITIATIQTLYRLDPKLYAKYFQLVITDECHHLSKITGTYGKVLSKIETPCRIGLTATWPTKEEACMALEGHIGPRIMEISSEQATDAGLLVPVKVKVVKVPFSQTIKAFKRYPDVYQAGITQNNNRNRLALKVAQGLNQEGKSVLVLVTEIEHGKRLKNMADLIGYETIFIWGSTTTEDRENLRLKLHNKQLFCVIANKIWKEGVDIPSLDCIINAAGGKSEIATLQTVGRGTRAFKDKQELLVIDFFDPSHYYLVSHFGERVSLYCEKGWL